MPHNRVRRNDDQEDPGQTHLNSDAKIAGEGRPQGAPLPIRYALGRAGRPFRYALGRAPTRGAPTDSLCPGEGGGAPTDSLCPGEGAHKGCPYQLSLGRAPTRGAPTDSLCPGEGAHKGRPYRFVAHKGRPYRFVMPWGGHPQGVPLPIRYGGGGPQGAPLPIRYALGRAPTRGAPTDSLCPGEGTHKGRPYRFAMPWGGHPQGAPLPIRYALGRAPTRGAPTDSLCPGEGAHKGRPYPIQAASRGFVPI